MQRHMTDDDIDYWMGDPEDPEDEGATFEPPYVLNRDSYGNLKHSPMKGAGRTESTIRQYVRLMIESIIDEDEDEQDGDETCEVSTLGGGAIRGYTGPLGAKKRAKKQDDVNKKSFGGGSYVS